jgi:hypothetical protein
MMRSSTPSAAKLSCGRHPKNGSASTEKSVVSGRIKKNMAFKPEIRAVVPQSATHERISGIQSKKNHLLRILCGLCHCHGPGSLGAGASSFSAIEEQRKSRGHASDARAPAHAPSRQSVHKFQISKCDGLELLHVLSGCRNLLRRVSGNSKIACFQYSQAHGTVNGRRAAAACDVDDCADHIHDAPTVIELK